MKLRTLRVFSRHPSHDSIRQANLKFPVLACIRFGSTTKGTLRYKIEINSPNAVRISANKFLMKQAFDKVGVRTAKWWTYRTIADETSFFFKDEQLDDISSLPYPLIAKNIYGSRNTGNYKINNLDELKSWMEGKDLSNYIFEQFFKKGREYRIHVTKDGYFYTCRKMLRRDAEEKWHRHDENCVWIKEENPLFDKPVNWDDIVADCVKALNSIGADVLAFDVKVECAKDKDGNKREYPDWILIESCSAPSFGEVTTQKYLEIIPKIIQNKLNYEPRVVS